MITPDSIHPRKGLALLRAAHPAMTESGMLHLPESSRYSNMGFVHTHNGKEESLPHGTLVLLEDEGEFGERQYYDIFKVLLRDVNEYIDMQIDAEAEPVFKETMEAYEANPSTHDNIVILKDVLTDETIKFNCSDVQDWGFGDEAHAAQRLEYIPTYMIDLWFRDKFHTFYIIDERKIMGVIRP